MHAVPWKVGHYNQLACAVRNLLTKRALTAGFTTNESPMNIKKLLRCMHFSLAVISLLLVSTSYAERPRIGLVLGGGGARGAAHIGVLKELERHRVPIDAIAGTSMGAVVGGLYASGKSPAELEDIVASLDWDMALADMPPRKDLSFRRKEDDASYPINFELGLRDGELLLPVGLVQGQQLDLILRELTIDVSGISDFDDLPVPFRAIATDIVNGEAYVMGQGDLSQAIRASMSVPAILAPAKLDGRLLVDGGIMANLPVDVMRDMDVDIIIAVDVEFPLYSEEELDSVFAISEQMLTVLMRRETQRQIELLGDADILIQPKLGTFASADFAKIMETVEPGEQAARDVSPRLQELALGEEQYAQHLAARVVIPPVDGSLAFTRVTQDGRPASAALESRLNIEAGDQIETDNLTEDAERLYGLGPYEQVSYQLVEEGGATGVEFQARSKSWGPDTLQFAIGLENDFAGSTAFNVGTRLTKVDVNSLGAEWRTDLQLGTDPVLFSEFYQPLGAGSRLFVAPRVHLHQTNLHAFIDDDAIARLRLGETELGVDLGVELGSTGEFRIGAYRGSGRARLQVGDPAIEDFEFDSGGMLARLRFDTRDDAQFPRSGLLADFTWNESLPGLGADERYGTVAAEFDGTWSRGKNSWQLGLSYATTAVSKDSIQDYFTLGGFLRLSGFERGEISGPHAALTRLIYYRRVGESAGGLLDVPIYVGASAEAGNVWQSRSDISFSSARISGSIFAGFDTLIGPIYVAAGFGEGGRTNYYLFFGSPPR
jgi:NTE family protein